MTVQTSTNVASFNGDGANKNFPIGYKFNSAADLVVLLLDDAEGTTQVLTLNSDYSVTGAGDDEGGAVTLEVAPTLDQRLKITRVVDIVQLTELRNQGKFYAEIHEDALDLLTMIAQQQQTEINNSLKENQPGQFDANGKRIINVGAPVLDTDAATKAYVDAGDSGARSYADSLLTRILRVDASETVPQLPPAVDRANRLLSFDASGNPVAVAPSDQSATALALEIAPDLARIATYPSAVGMAAREVPETADAFITLGYHAPGVGGALYQRFTVEPEAQAIIDQINAVSASSLTKAKEWAINRAIRQLKSGGLLAAGKIGALVEFGGAGQTEQAAALVDWIRPSTVTPTIAGSGGAVYTPGKGLQFSGSSYVTLGVGFDTIPGVSLNAAHAGVFITGTGESDYTQSNDNPMIGGGASLAVRPNNNAGAIAALINTSTVAAIGTQVAGRAGHTVANRVSSSAVAGYRDGELVGETASTSVAVDAGTVNIGRWATPGTFSTDTVGFAHFGGALTDADVALLYDVMTEYRHVIQSGANPGGLLQTADGSWWELGEGFERTPYHYGADEVNDTVAFRDLCAIKQDAYIPTPRTFFRVVDGFKVFARVRGDGARVRMDINTLNAHSWDMQDKSALKGLVLDHSVNVGNPAEGGQHCAVLLGRFHGTQTPVRDVEIDVKINMLTPAPAAVYLIGNVQRPTISYEVKGRQINGAAFLAHWGSQQSDASTEHVIRRPRDGHIIKGVAHSQVVAGHRGFYFSGVSKWRVDYLECRNFSSCMGLAPGDKPNAMDAACFNDTAGLLMSDLSFGKVILNDPAGTACRMWGRTAFINGARWYSTDLDSNAKTRIEELSILRSAATVQAGEEAIMLDIDIGANITIDKLDINHRPGTPSSVLDVLEPLVRINGGRNVKISGRAVGRVGTHVYSGHNIDLAIDAENPKATETSSASAGVWLTGELVTGQLTAALSAGGTTISLLKSPATHIVPGMEFEYGGYRYVFASSQSGDNLLDDTVVMKILPAPAAIASGQLITVLGGANHVKLHGSEYNYYRGMVFSGSDNRIPHDIHITPNISHSWDDHVEIDCGCGYYFHGGVMDFGNRRNDVAARDIRINANVRDVHITGVRFAPSPGSRLTVNHILANAGCSGIIARDNYGYGVQGAGAKFSIPATGADGRPNINANYEAP